jgi:hypothetical protein
MSSQGTSVTSTSAECRSARRRLRGSGSGLQASWRALGLRRYGRGHVRLLRLGLTTFRSQPDLVREFATRRGIGLGHHRIIGLELVALALLLGGQPMAG